MLTISGTLADLLCDLPAILQAGVNVERVEASDKASLGSPITGWRWFSDSGGYPEGREVLPDEVFSCVAGKSDSLFAVVFRTPDGARAALSDAVIAWAKLEVERQQNQQKGEA